MTAFAVLVPTDLSTFLKPSAIDPGAVFVLPGEKFETRAARNLTERSGGENY